MRAQAGGCKRWIAYASNTAAQRLPRRSMRANLDHFTPFDWPPEALLPIAISAWQRHLTIEELRRCSLFASSRSRHSALWPFANREETPMNGLRIWIIVAWVTVPTIMYGGYSLLHLINRNNALTEFQVRWFRAGHAHAGVLVLMSLLYYTFMDKTSLSPALKHAGCATLFVGILAQSGGFFIHMLVGSPNQPSIGNTVTVIGAVLLTLAIGLLVYGLSSSH